MKSLPDGERILQGYVRAVRRGDIHALTSADVYFATAKQIQNRIVGITAANGTKITGYSTHFIDRVIGQAAEAHPGKRKGVPVEDVLEALIYGKVKPVRVDKAGKESVTIKGKKCEVSINPTTGTLIQTNPEREKTQ